ncbi:MAG: CBS domain-containing protein [Myxococcales bacterium]|nr:MAG: CBS domain-containing protein [Myxococcales bacterium]
MKIKDVVGEKPTQGVVTITPEATVRDLLGLLSEHNIGAVVVSSDGRSVDGIVSERDVVRRLHGHDEVLGTAVSEIMTSDVHTAQPDHDLDSTRRAMTDRRIGHVPVVEDGALIGIISIGDVVKSHISQVEFERDQLDSYVHQS